MEINYNIEEGAEFIFKIELYIIIDGTWVIDNLNVPDHTISEVYALFSISKIDNNEQGGQYVRFNTSTKIKQFF
ncbi:hypothetical protein F8M41_026041 [Gigaspora margarita]|uniref:Uncharacterized protein n=1 Tax=Gigaspora margarita TaxID=4874 RepID=A0A8H4AAV5_GIGMA|nr:hypothetical protein F8M41_026041 [Gigaspora margarita]